MISSCDPSYSQEALQLDEFDKNRCRNRTDEIILISFHLLFYTGVSCGLILQGENTYPPYLGRKRKADFLKLTWRQ
jgi:hypothetical protein